MILIVLILQMNLRKAYRNLVYTVAIPILGAK